MRPRLASAPLAVVTLIAAAATSLAARGSAVRAEERGQLREPAVRRQPRQASEVLCLLRARLRRRPPQAAPAAEGERDEGSDHGREGAGGRGAELFVPVGRNVPAPSRRF